MENFLPCYSGQAFTQYAFQHEPGISVVEDLGDHPQKNSVRVGCFVHTEGYYLGLSSISETTPPLHPNQSVCLQEHETDRHRERYLYSTACFNSLSTMRWDVITWSIDVSCTLCPFTLVSCSPYYAEDNLLKNQIGKWWS